MLNVPVIVTVKVCPGDPNAGFSAMLAGGFTISVAVFELEKVVPDAVVPETDTRYVVGA